MENKVQKLSCITLALVLLMQTTFAFGMSVGKVTKEQLQKTMADGKTVIVDVRTGRDWKSSEFKIKGAVRPGKDIVKWASQYAKDTPLVLYCA